MKAEKPLKILVHAPLGVGGVTGLMLNTQRNMDRRRLNFDYLVFHDRVEPQEQAAFELGSQKLVASADEIGLRPLRGLVRLFKIWSVCKKNQVKILHFNGGAPMGFLNLAAAKLAGVRWITFHSHNGGMSNEGFFAKPVSALCRPLLPLVVDDYWACSSLAAKFSFPKKIYETHQYRFLPNGIALERFAYQEQVRSEVRKELGLEYSFVVGHAGRFNHQKNHTFLVDIFKEIHDREPSAVLTLFGVGELQEKVREKVHLLGLDDAVRFYGASSEMDRMYQAMDVFLMPSVFEGLPVTGVEAQTAGLPVVFSDTITKEVAVTENTSFVSLSESPAAWAEIVLNTRSIQRRDQTEQLRAAGFDQKEMVAFIQNYYLDVGKKLGSV